MDNRAEVRAFLTSRRAKVSPERAGLPTAGQRRVPGLRRSEVAALAGMSVEYYAKLERGSLAGASPGVLDALARALHLDEAEREHLLRLAHSADGRDAGRRRPPPSTVRPSLRWALDAITATPAIVGNNRMDLVAANPLGRAMYSDHFTDAGGPPNFARFIFFDGRAHRFYPDWGMAADICVANLRTSAGKDPHDKGIHDLVGELSTRSDEFRRRWAAHNVRTHGAGVKRFHHHAVGDLDLSYDSMDLRAEPDLALTIYTASPGSPTEDALRLLATWAATQAGVLG
ncbi:Transcriptional regulator, contains XRE-family HTH domain [Asanoa hainanensis]|uniref:Transcriptional regulator, contains XRE-family HTH domain n=1 Tax=Asanoa hainanensis TaxID=560556 RepID=A0A239PA04_9ACTN|nr:helix-turn-helix transcriptional regulator [Asanoa hainanensis]SNT63900.1 Transcriptional regulator, contains XRE-family HTH domain [Asanoa hainanensis]